MGEPDADFDALLAEQGELMEKIEHAEGWELDSRIEQAMDALRCPPGDEAVTHLSGGERRRVALCKLLLEQPDLLLLDEPTNHLDAESVQWLEQHLASYPGTILAVTHDRYFLDNVAEWILELDRGRAYPYEGNYSTYLEKKAERLKVQGKKDQKLERRLREELDWVRQNARGRQAKSKARLQRYEEMAAEAEKTRKLDFEEIQIPPGPRLGSVVVEASHLDKGFDEMLIKDLSFSLPRGGIVGVIGPNGVGKTTLFKMIVGDEKPDAGELRIGETVKLSYVDQSRGGLDPKKTVFEVVSDGLDYINVGQVEMPSRAYVSAFGFKGPDQQKPAGVLSGGERNRLNLALTLKEGGNVLLLDEPTNDLDVETLGSLENALLELPRLRRDHQPRPLVPRPHRDAHPRLGGRRRERREVVLVRGQLRVLREEQDRAARRRRGAAARGDAPQAHPRLMPVYPEVEPYDSGLLDVGDGHRIYWEVCGNPAGKPAVFLHGGPGGGCTPGHRRMFDPERYRVVLFDQRNCGRSLPHAADATTALTANTTDDLIADIERLREVHGIDRWLVWGGSWGSTLAFAYAERFPHRVTEMVLVAITNTSPDEIDWLYGGLGRFFPQEWDRFRGFVGGGPGATGTELAVAYDAVLQGPDAERREQAAREWCAWEDAVVSLDAERRPRSLFDDPRKGIAFARLCAHYFSRHGFLPPGDLVRNAGALRGIPGVMVHGRLDLTGPLATAVRMSEVWPDAELHVIAGGGHASGPGMGETIGAALDGFAASWTATMAP